MAFGNFFKQNLVLFAFLLLCISLIQSFEDQTLVTTQEGAVKGIIKNGFRAFLGIPYAEPPIGKLRWAPPVPKSSWSPNILDASKFGDCCPQNGMGSDPGLPFNESCLYLNVFAPLLNQTNTNSTFPVMVFVHGGAFIAGCSSQKVFYGDFFANSTDTILVTLNYRLGALGFLCNPDANFIGNYGILDQSLAFLWVQKNIAAFGGDPNRITIFGESAGAMSIVVHLVSPLSQKFNYFQSAIVESDPAAVEYRTKEEMAVHAYTFSILVECLPDDIDCFLSLDVKDIVWAQTYTVDLPFEDPSEALTEMPWIPTIDPNIVPDQPLILFSKGEFYKVPFIIGTNQNESASFGYNVLKFLKAGYYIDPTFYESLVILIFKENSVKILELYPPGDNAMNSAFQLATDFLFVCPTRFIALSASEFSKNPIRTYHFLWSSSSIDPMNMRNPWCYINGTVCHANELTYVFHSLDFYSGYNRTKKEQDLSWAMLTLWTDFAHQRLTSSQWPLFTKDRKHTLELTIPIHEYYNYDKANCDFWDHVGYVGKFKSDFFIKLLHSRNYL